MPNPTSDTAIQRPDLGALVYEYIMQNGPSMGYIGLEVMPLFPVAYQSASLPGYPHRGAFEGAGYRKGPCGAATTEERY